MQNDEYPHNKDVFTKDKVVAKVKQIRVKYRKAPNFKRKSGSGRVVSFFYDLCIEIWSGSPATEAINSGIESGEKVAEVEEAKEFKSKNYENDSSVITEEAEVKENCEDKSFEKFRQVNNLYHQFKELAL